MSSIVPSNPNRKHFQFNFENHEIRIISDENDEPLFVASDVCKALGIGDVGRAIARLDDDEKGTRQTHTPGGIQNMSVVTEAGLYSLIIRSDKPKAKDFKRWITHEVLPSIRKTGSYSLSQSKDLTPVQQARAAVEAFAAITQAIENQQREIQEHDQRLTTLETHVQTDVEYFTVMGYCRKMGLHAPSLNEAQSIGQRAANLSRIRGMSIGKTSDPRFGQVNIYHFSILNELLKGES